MPYSIEKHRQAQPVFRALLKNQTFLQWVKLPFSASNVFDIQMLKTLAEADLTNSTNKFQNDYISTMDSISTWFFRKSRDENDSGLLLENSLKTCNKELTKLLLQLPDLTMSSERVMHALISSKQYASSRMHQLLAHANFDVNGTAHTQAPTVNVTLLFWLISRIINGNYSTPLQLAAITNFVEFTGDKLHVNYQEANNDDTALHLLANMNHTLLTYIVLQHPNINPNLKNKKYETPLTIAAIYSNFEVAKLLLEHKATKLSYAEALEIKKILTENEKSRECITLIEKHINTLMQTAQRVLRELLNQNDFLRWTTKNPKKPMLNYYTLESFAEAEPDTNKTQLEKLYNTVLSSINKTKVEDPSEFFSTTVLILTLIHGKHETLKLLLQLPGLETRLYDLFHYETRMEAARSDMLTVLLENADLDLAYVSPEKGYTILHELGRITPSHWNDSLSMLAKTILQNPAVDPNATSWRGYTPLDMACWTGNLEMLKLLLDNESVKRNASTKEHHGTNPGELALRKRRDSPKVNLIENLKKCYVLVQEAFNIPVDPVHIASLFELTLHDLADIPYADWDENIEAKANELLQKSNPNMLNKNGITPLMLACQQGNPAMVKVLLQHKDINVFIHVISDEGVAWAAKNFARCEIYNFQKNECYPEDLVPFKDCIELINNHIKKNQATAGGSTASLCIYDAPTVSNPSHKVQNQRLDAECKRPTPLILHKNNNA